LEDSCGLWRVIEASSFASTLYYLSIFFHKEIFKIEIHFFLEVSMAISEKKKGLKNHQISEFGFPYVAKTMEG